MRVAKLNKLITNILIAVTAAVLLLTHLGEAGVASATPDQYDPRLDPNYSRETSETAPVNWEAVWGLVREFEMRTYASVGRSQPSSRFAVPQPWHYVQGTSLFDSSSPGYGVPVYGDPYALARYAYYPSLSPWWGESPRIPWWSLIPPRTHHHRHHRHHEGKGHHH